MARKKRKRDDRTIVAMTKKNLSKLPIDLFDELQDNVTAFADTWSVCGPLNISSIIPELFHVVAAKKRGKLPTVAFDEGLTIEDVIEASERVASALDALAHLAAKKGVPEFHSSLSDAAARMRVRLPRQIAIRVPNDGLLLLRRTFNESIEPVITAIDNITSMQRPLKRLPREETQR
jgi:hypothetical protein